MCKKPLDASVHCTTAALGMGTQRFAVLLNTTTQFYASMIDNKGPRSNVQSVRGICVALQVFLPGTVLFLWIPVQSRVFCGKPLRVTREALELLAAGAVVNFSLFIQNLIQIYYVNVINHLYLKEL